MKEMLQRSRWTFFPTNFLFTWKKIAIFVEDYYVGDKFEAANIAFDIFTFRWLRKSDFPIQWKLDIYIFISWTAVSPQYDFNFDSVKEY